MKSIFALICLWLVACAQNGGRVADPAEESGTIAVKITIPAALLQSVARVEYQVEAADMDALRGELDIVGNSARGTVNNIPPGSNRIFALNAYDSSGELSHTGSTSADIAAGRTTPVRISLLAVAGAAILRIA
ncbi:MAG: hypothetical protein ACKVJG_27140 [Candidatus Latescibacterota bacterium]|jgi:hypothetical protein